MNPGSCDTYWETLGGCEMGLFGWIALVVVGVVIAAVIQAMVAGDKAKRLVEAMSAHPGFSADFTLVGVNGLGLAHEAASDRVLFAQLLSNDETFVKVYDARDLVSVELLEDGSTVTQTARGSQVGGALVGAVLAGGVGAIIGGLSGKTHASSRIETIALRITVADNKMPCRIIELLSMPSGSGFERSNDVAKQLIGRAREWYSRLEIIIKRAERFAVAPTPALPSAGDTFAEKLRELGKLRDEGLLSGAEFDAQKARLLG